MKYTKDNNLLEVFHPTSQHWTKIPAAQHLDPAASFTGKTTFPCLPPLLSPTQTLLGARPPKPAIDDSVLYWKNQKIFLKLSNILVWLWLLYFYLTVKLHVYKIFYKHNTNNHWQFTSHLVTGKEKRGIRPSHILKGFEHVKDIQKIIHLCNILLALNY